MSGSVRGGAEPGVAFQKRLRSATLCDVSVTAENLRWDQYYREYHPHHHNCNYRLAFENCKAWSRDNALIRTLIKLKTAFYDFGFKLLPENKDEADFDNETLDTWLKQNAMAINQFRSAVWQDIISLDNTIIFWRDDSSIPAITLPAERCDYEDKLGYEKLTYRHGITSEQLKMIGLEDPEMALRFKTSEIIVGYKYEGLKLVPVEGEYFMVAKKAPIGDGFAWPSLMSIADALGQCESMEIGESLLAFAMRQVVRMHKIGHEIKNGPHAGWDTHFWKKQRSDKIKAQLEGKVGYYEFTTNFDHIIEYPWPDIKKFDASKWESVKERFCWWGGPVGWMIFGRGVNPYTMQMLRAEALKEREFIEPYLTRAFNEAFNPPVPLKIRWSNRCFFDSRIASEMLKFGVTQGLVSANTAVPELGFVPSEELEHKKEEMDMEKETPGLFRPIFDAAHGDPQQTAPAKKSKANGRPEGAKDPQNQI